MDDTQIYEYIDNCIADVYEEFSYYERKSEKADIEKRLERLEAIIDKMAGVK